jgi:oligopeptide/dipeptide ABC transporter ATP-binding protein
LINSIPKLTEQKEKLISIKGSVPDLKDPLLGCGFNTRCEYKKEICTSKKPELFEVEKEHFVSCYLYQ